MVLHGGEAILVRPEDERQGNHFEADGNEIRCAVRGMATALGEKSLEEEQILQMLEPQDHFCVEGGRVRKISIRQAIPERGHLLAAFLFLGNALDVGVVVVQGGRKLRECIDLKLAEVSSNNV